MDPVTERPVDAMLAESEAAFPRWEVLKDLVDEMIDLALNYRQSGHPGGSRSKVHLLLTTLLSGAMRWDVLRPWRPLSDRFVLSAGHTVPVVYATLAVLNEAMRRRHALEGGTRFAFPAWWHYDVLRGLEHLRRAGVTPDQRVAEAIELVASKRDGEGRWPLETRYPGVMPVEMDEGESRPSRWNTLRALRVLRWYEPGGREEREPATDPG